MAHDSEMPHRRSIRLRGYDYRQAGAYFVTISVQDSAHLFGEIVNGRVDLNEAGRIAEGRWRAIPLRFPGVELDEFVVMPDHLHGILFLPATAGDGTEPLPRPEEFGKPVRGSLATIVRSFKSAVSKRMHKLPQPPDGPIWQRGYYEHVIRSEASLRTIQKYIAENPLRREEDRGAN
jgi:REP element-mobilizing transposase RayT